MKYYSYLEERDGKSKKKGKNRQWNKKGPTMGHKSAKMGHKSAKMGQKGD